MLVNLNLIVQDPDGKNQFIHPIDSQQDKIDQKVINDSMYHIYSGDKDNKQNKCSVIFARQLKFDAQEHKLKLG